MSAPHSLRLASRTGPSFVLDDRSYPEVTRSDQYPEVTRSAQYPEVNREHEILETVSDYPKLEHNVFSPFDQKESSEKKPRNRKDDYRILGVRWWILIILVGIVAIAVAIAVGLAIGIPASNRKNENTDSASRLPSQDALTASSPTGSQPSNEPGSATSSSTPVSATSIPVATSLPNVKCPGNDTNIISTFSDDAAHTPDQIQGQNLRYKIACDLDYPGGYNFVQDLQPKSEPAGSLAECIERCSAFSLQLQPKYQSFQFLCSGVSLVLSNSDCVLKGNLTENTAGNPRPNVVDSAVLIWDSSS